MPGQIVPTMLLPRLYEQGCVEAVITQNIDGLHQESGLPNDAVVELHGNTRRVRCMKCSELSSFEDALVMLEAGNSAPECACGGYLKPDTISFGQAMPEKEMNRAVSLSKNSRCFHRGRFHTSSCSRHLIFLAMLVRQAPFWRSSTFQKPRMMISAMY
jgi:hypothetical protein